ncbi:hypothetical protein M2155_000651 [Streptomyces sp. SAI-119]|uniref:hypothetical protein n=1 Tax=Streptomyces sp. SAI-119 TaxID=2940541 RepID=UPI0024730F8C|nr:hypothetical protein [Streptomyces sp. SAI-119]MDH6448243.1 hypothetical protein [Streptomyces sp. SAI-119]
MTIQAIDTYYAGHYFRSRLEARWATVFDNLGVRWEYEPQGYRVGENRRPYLPDFYLTDLGWWVEVKGDPLRLDVRLLVDAVHPKLGLGRTDPYYKTNILILGAIPDFGETTPAHFSISRSAAIGDGPMTCNGGCPFTDVQFGVHFFAPVADLATDADRTNPLFTRLTRLGATLQPACKTTVKQPHDDLAQALPFARAPYLPHLLAAYDLGRTARFEHGQAAA